MATLDEKLRDILTRKYDNNDVRLVLEEIPEIKKAFKEAGYVHIPTGQNVTVTTGDNDGGKLMTEQEWQEKYQNNTSDGIEQQS